MQPKKYFVGIDVGSYSIGFAAIEVDEENNPSSILCAMSQIHDSGLDPDSQKTAKTRLAVSGVARRTRRLYHRRKKRTERLEKFLISLGWPVEKFETYADPYLPWKARAELATEFVEDPKDREEKLSIAIRHIANHRGWRNPYSKVRGLYSPGGPSDNFEEIRSSMSQRLGIDIPADLTVGQLISFASFGEHRIRGGEKDKDKKKPKSEVKQAMISARLQQSDHAREINRICEVQKISDDVRKQIIDYVFAAESPKGAQVGRVGKDPLQPGKTRALKASDAFQRYRIASLIGNLRIRERGEKVPLTADQRQLVFEFLVKAKKEVTWVDVSDLLGIDRGLLIGTASMTDDGERAGARPPIHETNMIMGSSNLAKLRNWWLGADEDMRTAMIKSLSNAEVDDWDSEAGSSVQTFFETLDEDEQEKLDSVHLPIGRAAYSESTLQRLTHRMLSDNLDLSEARRVEFQVSKDWTPPAPAIGEPVGNPAVDRVLKGVARWLNAAEREWGSPQRIVIEHVREGFMSEARAREIETENNKRFERNRELIESMQSKLGIEGKVRREDVWRFQSIQRQNGCCAYCESPITYKTAEMDHIVPQAGPGSTNRRENLLAVCHRCNLAKGNVPSATWAENTTIEGVSLKEAIERTHFWNQDNGLSKKDFKKFVADVVARLKRTALDEPIDNRSLESVAWMANELRARIVQAHRGDETRVNVYRGELTAEARQASGITHKLRFIGGTGKHRLDRRHHAVDAAVVSMTTPFVAETLAIRRNLCRTERITSVLTRWREFTGQDMAHILEWNKWRKRMNLLEPLLQEALDNDEIPVTSHLRLTPGNGRAHEDSIRSLETYKVGAELSVDQIDRASSEALWCALTRHPDFDPENGLPANPSRNIRVHGRHLDAESEVDFFPGKAGGIKVRGGFAELSRFHHARIYRVSSEKKSFFAMVRVYDYDLRKYRNTDVFKVELAPQTMSMRQSEPKLREAIAAGNAEYVGWIVVGDEIFLDTTSFDTRQMNDLREFVGEVSRWRIDGFFSNSKLRLRPSQLSEEGLQKNSQQPAEDNIGDGVKKILGKQGWLPAVNPLFSSKNITVIRRNSLGQERWHSNSHLPVSWKVKF